MAYPKPRPPPHGGGFTALGAFGTSFVCARILPEHGFATSYVIGPSGRTLTGAAQERCDPSTLRGRQSPTGSGTFGPSVDSLQGMSLQGRRRRSSTHPESVTTPRDGLAAHFKPERGST
ncbi:MAG TPA: hypothetical protein VNG12_24420 [Acidimicrobiales bacterium]|nr:hypothetical protein [Acidimicrobiales bacterium]